MCISSIQLDKLEQKLCSVLASPQSLKIMDSCEVRENNANVKFG